MKKLILLMLIGVIILSCNKDDNTNDNQYFATQSFDTSTTININLPQYNNLQFSGNHVIVPNYGINGIAVFNLGGNYLAFELSDPNHYLQSCSKLTVDGVIATCSCDDGNSYYISTGQPSSGDSVQYGLIPYYVEVSGNIIRVYNN